MKIFTSTALLLLLFINVALAQKKKIRLPEELKEVSGLYVAGTDSLWWLNDSGNAPALYLTESRGAIKRFTLLGQPGVKNRDWEDLTHDDEGNIYIGDFGNNANRRQDLCIYKWMPGGQLDSITFRYPDQTAFPPAHDKANFDMEGFFWYRDSLHLFSKSRLGNNNYTTRHYVLPDQAGDYTAQLKDSLYLKKRVVTGAAISRDGKTVVLLAYRFKKLLGFIPLTPASVFVFQNAGDTFALSENYQKIRVPKCLLPTQYEAIDFADEQQVWVATERTILLKQKARKIKIYR
ncbi:MAG TPA: hypothetical protein PKA00_23185 [Saprospiraceae bacterium]|nr:hypothetical protein [Saprospiraceae bacterium]HMQ85833.1 hypothetical protein [Saprospiraceae bacterium]